jgi:hypothetical protein
MILTQNLKDKDTALEAIMDQILHEKFLDLSCIIL